MTGLMEESTPGRSRNRPDDDPIAAAGRTSTALAEALLVISSCLPEPQVERGDARLFPDVDNSTPPITGNATVRPVEIIG